jgi:hypothetical protein
MKREELIKILYSISPDIVIVGGSAQLYFGYKETAKDIDVVVKSLKGFNELGEIKQWFTKSYYSKSGKRAFIRRKDFSIDIFIENELPVHETTKEGYKYETIESMIAFYKNVISKYDKKKQWKQIAFIQKKLDLITRNIK